MVPASGVPGDCYQLGKADEIVIEEEPDVPEIDDGGKNLINTELDGSYPLPRSEPQVPAPGSRDVSGRALDGPRVADHARRQIVFRDGRIVEDRQ